ncbi:hypothetical protein [Pontibacter mangrovi]|uniref:Lipoprotein n=1 Tax=Pontibacter mangrovi TaxID=2589816 RepID=A0A501VSB6_9BACT|nr:hypothetical protein [Pontibacter mangrovi]TPE40613.1 hypothetical protein FJM65_19940 [Pontibacter mangrovi]
MKSYRSITYSISMAMAGLAACTSLSEGQEGMPPPAPAEERVRLEQNPNAAVRQRMDEQASEINRKRNIEQFDQNKPAMTPNPLRPQELPHAPQDTSKHNLNQVWPTQVEPQPVEEN